MKISAPKPAFERSSGNGFADLGFDRPDEELAKAKIILRIMVLLRERGLTQTAAGTVLGLPQPKVSLLYRGRSAGFSTERLIRFLNRLGQDVDIVIRPNAAPRRAARVRVLGRAESGSGPGGSRWSNGDAARNLRYPRLQMMPDRAILVTTIPLSSISLERAHHSLRP